MSQISLPLTPLNTSFYNKNGLMNGDGEQLVSPTREEISTIFVVGFPEDMQEREFQNMFTFSSGFEAATLKVPSSKDGEEDISAINNIKKQIVIHVPKKKKLFNLISIDWFCKISYT
jgi:hypothetical protein